MRKVPLKNYYILGIIMFAVVALVFYLRGWYIASKEYYASNSIIKEVVNEINDDEIGNYIVENQKFVLYASSGSLMDVKDFEESLKGIINKYDISSDILYLNTDYVDLLSFNNMLKRTFSYNSRVSSLISMDSNCTLYLFDEGKIKYVLNNANNYSKNNIESLFEGWGIIND